ncbi:MAG: hypothetical protein NVS1B14_09690 [Vulcanimicrobiaceae bacterium]
MNIRLSFVRALVIAGAIVSTAGHALSQESPSPAPSPGETASPAPLTANPPNVAGNIGVSQTVIVSGALGPLAATLDDKIAGVAVRANAVVLSPIRNGRATLHITDTSNNQAVDVAVRIAPNAGTIPSQIVVKVTGQTDADFVTRQVRLALQRSTSAQPAASITYQPFSVNAVPAAPGAQTTIPVAITISGGDQFLDARGTTQVVVQNVAAQPFSPVFLDYSDDPEHITADGVLYRGTLTAGQPLRLYDYHDNGAQPRRLVVALSPVSTEPASVHMIEAFAGPNIDVMTVGHAVSRTFLVQKPRNQGTLVDLSGGPFFLRDVLMTDRQGVASATDFRLTGGGPVTITVLAVSPGVNAATLLDPPAAPGDGKNRRGRFALANYGTQALAYTAGAADSSTMLGDREPTIPKVNPNDPGLNYGDYGVIFELTFSLHNQTDQPQTAYLYEAPRGGPMRANSLIDNESAPVELGCATSPHTATSPPHRYLIRRFDLAPHATETHVVRTMTDGGSNFPVEIGMTANAPQPTTPPISAPDGCFPKPQATPNP